MAVGGKGCGKSTLFNNLVERPIITTKGQCEIDVYMLNLDGLGASQNIVFIDTPGFGASMDDEMLQNSIVDYIREQFDLFIEEESKIKRNPKYEDTRVHCLLYFIPATGNGMKQRDIVFLKKVSGLVNVIPIISKGDALCEDEKKEMQSLVNSQLSYYGIPIFDLENSEYLPPTSNDLNINTERPFVTICTNEYDTMISIRRHAAGHVEIDDAKNSYLSALREILLGRHMEMLMETTANDLYEKYRTEALESAINQK